MGKRSSIFAFGAGLILLVGALPAGAVMISSSVSFTESPPFPLNGSATAVDMMQVFIQPVAGVTFQNPGLDVYDIGWGASGWVVNDVNPMYSNASGAAMSTYNYILHFNIDGAMYPSTVAFGVDVYYFQNIGGVPTLIDSAGLTYNGPSDFQTNVNNWGVTNVLNPGGLAAENSAAPVPEPLTASLGLLGIGGLALAAMRRRAA